MRLLEQLHIIETQFQSKVRVGEGQLFSKTYLYPQIFSRPMITSFFKNTYYSGIIGAWKTMPQKEYQQVAEVTKRRYEEKHLSLN